MSFYSIYYCTLLLRYERIREDRYPCGMLQPCGQIAVAQSSPVISLLAVQPARGREGKPVRRLEGREEQPKVNEHP
jgi:hypothetical protein